jgi:hypothetical protein
MSTDEEKEPLHRYIEIVFRSRLRLFALLIALPIAISGLDAYLWRSYDASAVVIVDDPASFGQSASGALGYNPYITPSQNVVIDFSNLLGTERFNNRMADTIAEQGLIRTPGERTAFIASLTGLSVTPGAILAGGGGGPAGGGYSANLTLTIQYITNKSSLCAPVIKAALEVLRSMWIEFKAQAAQAARQIYELQLKTAQAKTATAIAALQKYDAQHPRPAGQPVSTDPVRSGIQHDVDVAQREADVVTTQIDNLDTFGQIPTAMANDMNIIDGPKIQKGLFGISGLRSDNLKTDAVAWVICLLIATSYLILVALVDRSVREPGEIQKRLAKQVFVIPDYRRERGFRLWRKRAAT